MTGVFELLTTGNWTYGDLSPGTTEEEQISLDELTPREIVAELDKYVVGQKDAKRAVAIALRNRMRRQSWRPIWRKKFCPRTSS